jgi:hypothetical protein
MVIFDHRRKCAGRFIARELMRRFSYAAIYAEAIVSPLVGKVSCLFGHDVFAKLHKRNFNSGTFYFTCIRHPVDCVYSAARHNYNNVVDGDLLGKGPHPKAQTLAQHVRWFVDMSIDSPDKLPVIWQLKRQWWTLDLDSYHFVGVVERMAETCDILNGGIGTSFDHTQVQGSYADQSMDITYRRGELEAGYKTQIEQWEEAKRRLDARKAR